MVSPVSRESSKSIEHRVNRLANSLKKAYGKKRISVTTTQFKIDYYPECKYCGDTSKAHLIAYYNPSFEQVMIFYYNIASRTFWQEPKVPISKGGSLSDLFDLIESEVCSSHKQ